ncbi:MAG: SpvB/TcaC N-terminal domain-containing protein, partial [Bacteroidota bacterium]
TYSIPISMPSGINDLTPELKINYSSQGGNSLLGWGWNLSGMSRITRGTTSLLQEGYINRVTYSNTDRFFLDGSRLILTKGTYGEQGSEYRTELDNLTKIKLLSENGEPYFEVHTNNGEILTYGKQNGSRKYTSTGKTSFWSINERRDLWGNTISYHYVEAGEQKILDRIEYANNKVEFDYQDRSGIDGNTTYMFGESDKTSNILKKIKVYANSEIFREYKFNYTKDLYLLLHEITLTGEDNSKVNSTIIDWNEGGEPVKEDLGIKLERIKQYGDFNGDGRTDILTREKDAVNSTVFIAADDGFEEYTFEMGTDFEELRIDDFDMDGKDEILLGTVKEVQEEPESKGLITVGHDINYKLYGFTGSGFAHNSEDMDINYYAEFEDMSSPSPFMLNADFNGDGIIDYIVLHEKYLDSETRTFSLITEEFSSDGGNLTNFLDLENVDVDYIGVLNFNGNSKMDLLVTTDTGTRIYEYSNDDESFQVISGELNEEFSEQYQVADFNGDGRDDFTNLIVTPGGFNLYYSTGKDLKQQDGPFEIAEPENIKNPYEIIRVHDLNSDGKSDLLRFYFTATRRIETIDFSEYAIFTPKLHVYAYLSTGEKFVEKNLTSLFSDFEFDTIYEKGKPEDIEGDEIGINYDFVENIRISIQDFPKITFSDFNKDGNIDLIVERPQDSAVQRLSLVNGEKKRLVNCITNGLNIHTHVNYESLNKSSHYDEGSEHSLPLRDYDAPYYVVTNYQEEHNDNTYSDVNLNYTDSKFHIRRGFLGFKSIEMTDSISGKKQVTHYETLSPLYTRAVESTQTYYEDNQKSSVTYSNKLSELSGTNNSFYRKYTTESVSTDHTTGVTKTKTFGDFDEYYQPQIVITEYGSAMTITKEISYTNIDNDLWIPGRKDMITVKKNHEDGSEISNKTVYSYKDDFKLTSRTNYANTDMPFNVSYTYDSFGNTETKERSDGNKTRKTKYTYTSDHRFLETKIEDPDNLSFKTEYVYDPVSGNRKEKIDMHGRKTTYEYDGFGNRTKTIFPDGDEKTTEKVWIEEGLKYQVVENSTTAPAEYKTYNMAGQLLKKETSNFSKEVKTAYEYYDNGKLHKEYEPYSSGKGNFTEYIYDEYGRISEKRLPDDNTITYTYDGLKTTKNSPGEVRTETKDAYGLTDVVEDKGGVIDYTYYGDGNLRKVTYNNANYSFEYDAHGNRTKIKDPDAGTITSTYNGFDELVSQTDARGNTYTFEYDQLGRKTKRILEEGGETTEWIYDENGNKGLLTTIDGKDVDVVYTYDNNYRVSSVKETIDGKDYITAYDYDKYGREKKVVYPSGKHLLKSHTSDGFVDSLVFDGKAIWTAGDMNVHGQWKKFTYGNGLTTHKTYDPMNHLPTSVKAGSVFEYYYSFDEKNGNLSSRGDSIMGEKEIFDYDELNRLTADKNGELAYQTNGNIDSKSGIGNYAYNTTKPHAVSGITEVASSYSPAGHDLEFTAFNKIQEIEGENTSDG